MHAPDEIATKLSAARTRLILERPFLGALVMHLPLQAVDAKTCDSVATDARALYYHPAYIERLSLAQTQFILAHEALHCALGHFARRSHRVIQRWNIACDHAVNLLLLGEGLRAPPNILANDEYRGLSAEEIYPLIPADSSEQTLDKHLFDQTENDSGQHDNDQTQQEPANNADDSQGTGDDQPGEGDGEQQQDMPQPSPGGDGSNSRQPQPRAQPGPHGSPGMDDITPAQREELAQQWRGHLASAAQQARMAGRLGESWLRLVDELIAPRLPWRMLLARYLMNSAREDYSFQRVSRREGAAMLPSLYSRGIQLIAVLDTSGSITDTEMHEFAAEIDALKGQINAQVTLHACDERLAETGPWRFEPWEAVTLPDGFAGGGGTDFRPVFEWIAVEQLHPDLLIYFTDAEGEFPEYAPAYPVLWLVKGKAPVPWGERVQLN
ncbi:MAG TPA: VWA-like domain-containing protein [Sulfuriferula sp.]|nr:VWA-like domain-containing protein [Sulfuriferula sp.]